MEKINFNIYLLDDMSYPITKYGLEVERPISEDKVRQSFEKILKQITSKMMEIEIEEDRLAEIRKGKSRPDG